VVALGVATSLYVTDAGALYDAASINSQLIGGTATAARWDEGCWNTMHDNRTAGMDPRTAINSGGAYAGTTWVSAKGAGVTTTINVAYGTKLVDLQLNNVTFLCSSMVRADGAGADYSFDNYRVVHNANAPNDRRPNPMGGHINWPARTDDRFRVDSATSNDGGAISLAPNTVLQTSRNDSSRYWFASPLAFTYTSPSDTGITSDTVIKITVNGRPMSQYYGNQDYCGVGSDTEWSDFLYGNCGQSHPKFTVTLKLNPKYDLTPSVGLDQASNSVTQAGMGTVVSPNIANAGPTSSSSAAWQLSRFIVTSGGSYPAGVHESDSDPATYYGNGLVRIEIGRAHV